ncbi:MAG: GxxExxY protein [Thermodesulfovibrionia bacterium]|nr:GxxExxY protein [Thermodesulfovibrionia bacterium]
MKDKDPLTEKIIGCCFKVNSELGPGFHEKIYHNALKLALREKDLTYQTEKAFKVFYQDVSVGSFKADLMVEDKVIVELKSLTGNIPNIFESQVLSYLKASGLKIGLLVNFGNRRCQIKRLIY